MADVKNLNDEQQKAVEHGTGPLLIIAGAGTGKTTVVTQRIKHLIIGKHIDPSCILALTFTEKAATEMEERVDVALPYGYTQLWISTFHAFCDRVLRDEAIHIGLHPGFKLASEAESLLFFKKNLFRFTLDYFRPLGNPYKFMQGMLQHFDRLKDDDINPQDYFQFAKNLEMQNGGGEDPSNKQEIRKTLELANAYKTYEELKVKEGIMDFADLHANVLKLFRERPNILRHYQDKFEYILVDEFQDTNYAQNELAMLLAGKKNNITVVGDDDQSIYRWRGAAIANIVHFRKRYPQATVVALTKNYRSSPTVLEAAYTLIQHNNPDRLEVQEGINKKLQAMKSTEGGNPSVLSQNDKPVEFLYANRVENEAEIVKDHIKKLIKEHALDYRDIAILVRANDHAQPFARALERARIPYQFLGPGHLYHQEEIKDIISYLKLLTNFEDNAAFYRILTMPIFHIEARDIAALLNFAKKQNLCLFEACEQIDQLYVKEQTKDTIQRIVGMIKRHLEHVPRETAGQILYYFLEDSGLLQQYLGAQLPQDEKRAQNIAKFFDRLRKFETSHDDASIFAVIDWIDLAMELGESPLAADVDWSSNNAVNILTVHSSKGLEFPAVFLTSLVTQRFPSRARKEQIPVPEELIREQLPQGDPHLQEERRLFYVGMTRAKDYLYLTASQFYGEGRRERKISPFVTEALGEGYVNMITQKKQADQYVQQLSLLDLANDQAQKSNQAESKMTQQSEVSRLPITAISYSQITTFDICPLHYKLKYLLKIPPAPTASQSFGTSIHAVLREFYRRRVNGEDSKNIDIETLLKTNWVSVGYESRDHMLSAKEQAKNALVRFLNINGNTTTMPLGIEVPFSFFLSDIKIVGRIDRIDPLPDGKIEIIDYKTGSNIPEGKKLDGDTQLSLYALAASLIHDTLFNKRPGELVLSLWYVESDTKISTMRTAEQLESIKQQLLTKVEEIATSNFSCSGSILCKNCEYRMLCNTVSDSV